MTVLYFLMTAFSYSKFYRMNCIMFTFTISSFLWNIGLWGGGVRPELYNFFSWGGEGLQNYYITLYGEEGVKNLHFSDI